MRQNAASIPPPLLKTLSFLAPSPLQVLRIFSTRFILFTKKTRTILSKYTLKPYNLSMFMFLGGVFACFSGGGLPAGYCLDALGKKANAFQITSCIATKLSSRLFPFLLLIPFSLIPLVCLHIVSYLTAPQNSSLYRCPTDSALELPPCPIVWQGQPWCNTLPPERSVRVPKTSGVAKI